MKTYILICLTLLFINTNNNEKIIYRNCDFFEFKDDSKECEFIEKLNTDIQKLKATSKEFYITRFINDATKEIEYYDIVGYEKKEKLNTDLFKLDTVYVPIFKNDSAKEIEYYDIVVIGTEKSEFLQINYSKKLEDYFTYLEKAIPQVVIYDFYD